ncbi:nuclear transport factor 2 family protein [Sphingomonas jaspsi]|uniref:nuclear transport factor 2 family protein n=1 Tax=Sphingomonas jaspsi TaxID=392409 RepID=UPI0004B24C9F|nr:nuclear transport factor 2 family protein [Sphingomonas jaspsi]
MFAALFLAAATPAIPTGPALTAAIRQQDSTAFALMFDRCDPAALRGMMTDDFEFYHDKGGLMAGGDTFAADAAKSCAEWVKPNAWRSRRELVEGTVQVDPVPGYGAIETGEHLFYERQGSGPEKLVGRARFAIVWAYGADQHWRMRRALSYDHAAASAPTPMTKR